MVKKKWQVSLRGRVVLFLAAFLLALSAQMFVNYYQSSHVLSTLDRQTGTLHTISRFLSGVETSLTTLENYRWGFGDRDALSAALQDSDATASTALSELTPTDAASIDQLLLGEAVRTTYKSYQGQLLAIMAALGQGRADDAAELYYDKALPCGGYLRQYTQQLLETSMTDGQSSYAQITALNARLVVVQSIGLVVCLLLGAATVATVLRILTPVQQMVQASQAITAGDFTTPDIPVRQQDEIGQLAAAFNRMKHSMLLEVETLNEKNAIQRELHKKQTEALELQSLMAREKLQQLRSQIDPHFLFNTLNVILHSARQEQAWRTQTLLSALSHLLRYSLASNDLLVPLSREVRIIDEFYSIYRVRFGERVNLEWRISDSIDLTETMVPSFILQPLVENAFKHGICPKEDGGRVRIRINRLAGKGLLFLSVSDDGLGMPAQTLQTLRANLHQPPDSGEHIGLYNVAARLRLFDERCKFDVHSRYGHGTCAVMYLPLIETPEETDAPQDTQEEPQ